MMKTYRYITYLMLLFAVFAFAACDDDESGQPVIERVRLTDPDKADSTFTEAYLGQMILIEGHDLDGARNIYINNQDCYFNSNYNTSSHIIMTIPSDLVVYGQDNSLPMEIRVETTHGSATYSFHVIAGSPSVEYYKTDSPLNEQGVPEMQPGQAVVLYGSLFHEISAVYVADLDTVKIADCQSYTLNDDCTELTVITPTTIPNYGIIVVECYAGTAYCGFAKSPMEPELYDVSPDMPVPGQTVTLVGKYLTDVTAINIGGEIDIDVTTVTTTDAMDKITFVMPETLPSKDHNGTIRLNTLGGKAELPFYIYDNILEDFDGNGTSQNWYWGTSLVGAYSETAASFTVASESGNWLGMEDYSGYWDHNMQFNGKAAPSAISESTPLSSLELRYEVYLPELPSATCYSEITFMGTTVSNVAIADRITGETKNGVWMSVSIPLTSFGSGTYGDLIDGAPGDDGNFKIYHNFDETGIWFSVVYDNLRIYQKK